MPELMLPEVSKIDEKRKLFVNFFPDSAGNTVPFSRLPRLRTIRLKFQDSSMPLDDEKLYTDVATATYKTLRSIKLSSDSGLFSDKKTVKK
uniref:Uncharacterized protein n=1 Tax=Syphacia muris TaxID=451379 RepID=A0A0N5AM52_9BILA